MSSGGGARDWFVRHLQTFIASLGRLSGAPLATLMTAAVIGVALSLPAGLYVILGGVNALAEDWEISAGITLFLKKEVEERRAAELSASLRARPAIDDITFIPAADALAEFRRHSGLHDALDILEENPLPNVIVIEPVVKPGNRNDVDRLVSELRRLPEVESAQLDLVWLERFRAITRIANRAVLVLVVLFGLAVVLITGNTIRLEIRNRQIEIEIVKMVGGTDAFIRRPFLYNGLIYGLLGGLIAWVLVLMALNVLSGAVNELALLYESRISMPSMTLLDVVWLLGGSGFLGLAGSWMVVGRYIRSIEPV
jgi:cell division transport system permease protein